MKQNRFLIQFTGQEALQQRCQAVGEALASRRCATVADLADDLDLDASRVRDCLAILMRFGLVAREYARLEKRRGARPYAYHLTERGVAVFGGAGNGGGLDMGLPVENPALSLPLVHALGSRLRSLASWLDTALGTGRAGSEAEQLPSGFMPRVSATVPGGIDLVLDRCPVWFAARGNAGVCEAELAGLQRLFPGHRFERTAHRLSGAADCRYHIASVAHTRFGVSSATRESE